MRREFGYDHITRDASSVITTGTFDGVHRGHQAIIRYLVDRARHVGGTSTVISFDPHPREVLSRTPVPLLTTLDERAVLLEALGVDRFVVLPFNRYLSLMEPERYVAELLLGRIGMREAVIGYDHHFGKSRAGDRYLLESLGEEHGFTVDVIPEQVERGITVSSTEIRRELVEDGDAERAAQLLGRPYFFSGLVVRGNQRGRSIGYPTANLRPLNSRKVVPKVGVYAVEVTLPDGRRADGMMNVGRRPTFEEEGALTLEVHIFDFSDDIYGSDLDVSVVKRLRDESPFSGAAALRDQLVEDALNARQALERGEDHTHVERP